MKNCKNYLFLVFFICTFKINGQAIDQSILSQLSPEQIEFAKAMYAGENSANELIDDPEIITESLIVNESSEDSNKVLGKKYGYDFFSSMPTSLTAVGDLPLPNDYKISLRDQFKVILSGSKNITFNLNVKLDGTILFPELGAIYVVGLSLQEVKDKLTELIGQSYIGVNIDISIQNVSAKKITIVGAVKTPGTYLVNPFSTITSALAYSGGISEIGSLRDIKLIRNNKEVFSFDLYDLLIRGDRSKDHTIEAGDTILINAASQFVEITGAVKRPAIYEILDGENVKDIIDFALGFTQTANKSNISVSFLDLNEAKIYNKNINDLKQSLKNALAINVFGYLNEDTANIQVIGAVQQPGFYEIKKYKNLKNLIADLKFVDVYPWLGVLEQFDDKKLIKSSVLFNLNDPSTYNSIKLLPNSVVYFTDINDRSFDDVSELTRNTIDDYELTINHKQGTFRLPVYGKYSVSSFIDLLGLDMSDVDINASYISPLDDIVISDNYKNMQFVAKKYHTVSFRSPTNNLISVNISGAVNFPGTYVLDANSSVEDLYELVGGFKSQAYFDGIILTRESIRERQTKALEKAKEDLSNAILTLNKNEPDFNINIIQALSEDIDPNDLGRLAGDFSPNSQASRNTILFDGDQIIVPKNSNTINVIGAVFNPVAFEFTKKTSIISAIENAGGFKQYADKRRVYVITANGITNKANRNIFTRNIKLMPGDTIVVPRKIITNNPGIDILAPITGILSDLAFSAAALDNLRNN